MKNSYLKVVFCKQVVGLNQTCTDSIYKHFLLRLNCLYSTMSKLYVVCLIPYCHSAVGTLVMSLCTCAWLNDRVGKVLCEQVLRSLAPGISIWSATMPIM